MIFGTADIANRYTSNLTLQEGEYTINYYIKEKQTTHQIINLISGNEDVF